MTLRLRATGCHLSYGITQCYLPTQVNTPRLNHNQRPVLDLLIPEGWKAELTFRTVCCSSSKIRRRRDGMDCAQSQVILYYSLYL